MRIESVEPHTTAVPSGRPAHGGHASPSPRPPTIRVEEATRVIPTTLPGLLALAHRHRYVVLASVVTLVVALLAPALVKSRTYTAHASFILAGGRTERSGLGAFAAELGLPFRAGDPARSPAFYADLLTTRAILQAVAQTPFPIDGRQMTLVQHYEIDGASGPRLVQRAADVLRKNISVRMESQTGMVMLSVTAAAPGLAERIAAQLLEELNKFNLEVRRSQAANERRFVSERYEAAQRELMAAEAELQAFLVRNRAGLANSPQLSFQNDRLERNVALRQRIFASLAESVEHARIEEVRDTPVITVIDAPAGSSVADGRGAIPRLLLGLVLGVVLGLAIAIGIEIIRSVRGAPVAAASPVRSAGR